MKKLIFILPVFIILSGSVYSQGCVAIRNITGFGQFAQLGYGQSTDKWMMDINNRYFEAYRFLDGKKNITPSDLSSGVTLYEYTMNLQLTRVLEHGWNISLDMPVSSNETYGALEHASGDVHSTHAFGIGDLRFTVYKWLFNSVAARKGNIQVGLGIKLPTGNYQTEDYFYTSSTDKTYKELAPVNVAIQLGDGGTGITTQLNAYYIFNPNISIYGNFFYLISPKDVNGVASWPPGLLPADAITLFHATTYDVNSVPDGYTLRGGANFSFNKLVVTTGLRYEGAPAHDLIGKDDGLRRVGHIFSAEPGLQYKFKTSLLYAFVTLPVARATIETVPDERMAAITGMNSITPGHFANSVFFIGYTFTF
ncbi:MAG TPA: hypothetical protein VIJ92_10470 [Ginsengibacter sp.]